MRKSNFKALKAEIWPTVTRPVPILFGELGQTWPVIVCTEIYYNVTP